ncbi:hypothetical protein FM104_00885 [Microbacterium esteraromaticum]|uniref:DUF306 domain-containing protein n=2 Tax=Microbacterium esteraromaticum TaxID=57043 RepID=A0A1R4I9Z0_9MICO|nr:hypothetical protein FM104_00885 [Microbacterium esteraromaticum]
MVATIILLALYVVTMLAAVLRRSAARPIAVAGVVILVLAPVVTYAAVAWSSGFILSEAGELGADIQTIVASPTDDPVGQWGEVGERSAFLTVLDDGTVAGSDGCNGMSGAWSVSDGRVVFSDMITSLMMCSGLESELQGSVVAAVASGDTLYVLDENGGLSGVLSRAPNQ